MRKLAQLIVAISVVALVSVMPSAGAGKPFSGAAYQSTAHPPEPCVSGGEQYGWITYVGPDKLWPPNHKYAVTTVTATSNDLSKEVTLTTTAMHDQMEGDTEANGSGHTMDDIVIDPAPRGGDDVVIGQKDVMATSKNQGSVMHWISLRAERAGTIKAARTYTLQEDATMDGHKCDTVFFTVEVPHDMRLSNR